MLVTRYRRHELCRDRWRRGRRQAWAAALAQEFLHTLDRKTLLVEILPDLAQQQHVIRAVITTPAGALHRPDLGKFRLPKAKHMLRHFKFVRYLADCPESFRGFGARSTARARFGGGVRRHIEKIKHTHATPVFGARPLPSALLIWPFKTCEARKMRTRRGLIGTSLPVFGLRPKRRPLRRTAKLPKDEILTISPRARASEISPRTISTSSADSLRESPTS